jgi:ParB family transcriptional regulator, chromosome partitioning protein
MDKPKGKKSLGASAKRSKKIALGRGLDALLPDIEPVAGETTAYFECAVEQIRPNRYQPRLRFAERDLEELAQSIEKQGIIQPLLVRKDDSGYELITGERRLRAAKKAGLKRVPVVIKSITDADLLEMSIIENVQREDLNPMEEADAYHRLMTEFGLTQEQAAERVGKSRSTVANLLRLRQLPGQIKSSILAGSLSMGHARALLAIESSAQQNQAFRTVVSKKLSVRETENLIKRLKEKKKTSGHDSTTSEQRYYSSLSDDLSRRFGTKVQIKKRGQRGMLAFEFYSNDDLDRLLNLLMKHIL